MKLLLGFSIVMLFSQANLIFAQTTSFYTFLKDDSAVTNLQIRKTKQFVKETIASFNKDKNKKTYEDFYNRVLENATNIFTSKEIISSEKEKQYLQQIANTIIAANPVLASSNFNFYISRSNISNAYTLPDGTIVFNAGLFIQLKTEAEVAFILAHEMAHAYFKHSQKSIAKYIEFANGKELQDKLKKISKEKYGQNKMLDELTDGFVLNSRRHDRTEEIEADAFGFELLKNTYYNINASISVLEKLKTISFNDNFSEVDVKSIFTFKDFPFKDEWIAEESRIFAELKADTLTKEEKEKYATHPNCDKRIAALNEIKKKTSAGGTKNFIGSEEDFRLLQQKLRIECIEYAFTDERLSEYLFYNLILLQSEEHKPMAKYNIVKTLNTIYEKQKIHKLYFCIDNESTTQLKSYNMLLKVIAKVSLEELAGIAFNFALANAETCGSIKACEQEWKKAASNYQIK
jgi:Zn-dependent protease with chaperone function